MGERSSKRKRRDRKARDSSSSSSDRDRDRDKKRRRKDDKKKDRKKDRKEHKSSSKKPSGVKASNWDAFGHVGMAMPGSMTPGSGALPIGMGRPEVGGSSSSTAKVADEVGKSKIASCYMMRPTMTEDERKERVLEIKGLKHV